MFFAALYAENNHAMTKLIAFDLACAECYDKTKQDGTTPAGVLQHYHQQKNALCSVFKACISCLQFLLLS